MANEEHVARLRDGVANWNQWRRELKPTFYPDLSLADFSGANLQKALLRGVNLTGAVLVGTNLAEADLDAANLNASDLTNANLFSADLTYASLDSSKMIHADLVGTIFRRTDFGSADLSRSSFSETIFAGVDLSRVVGLDSARHGGPSTIDFRTLKDSGPLPLAFMRGVGLSDEMIEYLPSLLNQPIQHYSCFISYSSEDQRFASRLHADLQSKGVRCWFAPHDMRIGEKILDTIDAAIRLRDKVLLILSKHSIKSDWVEGEVTKAFEEERTRGRIVLFPIRLDNAVMSTNEAWAAKLRARHIGDFRRWKEHDEYQKSFERVLRDLTVKKD